MSGSAFFLLLHGGLLGWDEFSLIVLAVLLIVAIVGMGLVSKEETKDADGSS